MKRMLLFMGLVIGALGLCGQVPVFDWVAQIGGTGEDMGRSIATDQNGNIFVSGTFSDTCDFDPDPNIYYPLISEGSLDIFVAKFTPDGQLVWALSFGDIGYDTTDGIATDNSGNVVLSGVFSGTIDFDSGVDTVYLTASSAFNTFILKLDNDGSFIWVKHFEDFFRDQAIITDEIGNLYVTGTFYALNDFDPGPDTFYLGSSGSADIFVLKLDIDGNFIWVKGIGGEGFDIGNSIALDGEDNVFLTGWFEGIADFDPGPDTYNLWTGGFEDDRGMFITKLNSEGSFVWAMKVGDSDSDVTGHGIAVDSLGNSYTVGKLRGEADFDPGSNTNILTSESDRAFVMKLNSAGNYCWVTAMEGDGRSIGSDIALDKHNNVYTIGYFRESVDFDPGVDTFILNAAFWDTYILKLDSTGDFFWAGSFYGGGSTGEAAAGSPSITIDQKGNIYTTGFFINSNDFDPGEEVYELLFFGGVSDAFIHKMRQYCFSRPTINMDSDMFCQGDTISLKTIMDSWVSDASFLWSTGDTIDVTMVAPEFNSTYTVEVNYEEDSLTCTLTTAIDINVLPIPNTTMQEFTSCDSLSAGQQVWIYSADNNCDSIVVINTLWLPIPAMPQVPIEILIPQNTSLFEINIPSVDFATTYEWTVPSGVQIVTGIGTNAIILDWSAVNTGGSVCVSAINECGTSIENCMEVIVDFSDAINEVLTKTYSVYPNPVDEALKIVSSSEEYYKVALYDILGRLVLAPVFQRGTIQLVTRELQIGTYWLKLSFEEEVFWEQVEVVK